MGRIEATVLDVFGDKESGLGRCPRAVRAARRGLFLIPPTNALVWIEFEQGDPSFPIFAGCRCGLQSDVPTLAHAGLPVSPNIVLQTAGQNTLVINDLPGPTGGIMLESLTGATLIVNDTGIYIQNGKGAMITLIGPTVTINTGAMVIT